MRRASPKAMPAASMVTNTGTGAAPDCRTATAARAAAPLVVTTSKRRAEGGRARQFTARALPRTCSLQPRPADRCPPHRGPAHRRPANRPGLDVPGSGAALAGVAPVALVTLVVMPL